MPEATDSDWPLRDSIALSSSARNPRIIRAQALATGGAEALPEDLAPRRLLRRLLQVAALVGVLVLVVLLAPGLGDVRERLEGAAPGWLAVAVALEALSCGSYLLMFRPVFCRSVHPHARGDHVMRVQAWRDCLRAIS